MSTETRSRATTFTAFTAFFNKKLVPILTQLERTRKIRLYGTRGLAGALIFIGVLLIAFSPPTYLYFLPLVVLFGGVFYMLTKLVFESLLPSRERRGILFSKGVIAATTLFAVPDLRHIQEGQAALADIVSSGLFGANIELLRANNQFQKTGQGYDLSFSWVKIAHSVIVKNNGRKQKQQYSAFTGWFFTIRFPKRFRGETIVTPDKAEAALSWLGRSMQQAITPRGAHLILLEDAAFEKRFKVLSTGEMEARYVLTPAFMQAAVRTEQKTGPLYFMFRNECMFVAIPAVHEYLDGKPTRSFLDPAFAEQLYHAARGIDELTQTVVAHQKVWDEH